MADQKEWKDYTKGEKITSYIVVTVFFVGIIWLFIFLGGLVNGDNNPKPLAAKTDGKTSTTTVQKADLATRVDKEVKESIGVKRYTDSATQFAFINGMKTEDGGWVGVNYQTDCDKGTATFIAKQVMGMAGGDNKDLKAVNVTCTNGTSSYATRDGMFTD